MNLCRAIKRSYRLMIDRFFKKGTFINERYQVNDLLGVGSYGISYLCEQVEEGKVCVVKQMTRSKRKKRIAEVYRKETEILGQLNHPNIPTLMECFVQQDFLFFSMEYINGKNLEDKLFEEREQFSEKYSLTLVKELVNILDYIHRKGICHGDIRIPNVILTEGKVNLIDFGLAIRVSNENKVDLFREDFYDIGDFLLFLLYSNYKKDIKKRRPWTEELSLHPKTIHLLKRLLGIEQPYSFCRDITVDIEQAIELLD
ncbi:protein kinase [Aquibacillus koreensis]|uniref:Protein kinase n=1 Tax=Aquibacillus koreensis TaxID=279446 RepID=A0A9X4AK28_9BACI|nr:protein kinase [Aquibacillus koreensis]MCT2537685.1 protein kinase [Aquibacillus koreensis]MDC3420968.1 protein kinase [Aquibacillus koreensis]